MATKTNIKTEIDLAAANALKVLASASEAAAHAIASAAASATSVIAQAASEAAKLTTAQAIADRELLVVMKQQIIALKEVIENLKEELIGKVSDHEKRIVELERYNIRMTVVLSIGILGIGTLFGMVYYHLVKMPA